MAYAQGRPLSAENASSRRGFPTGNDRLENVNLNVTLGVGVTRDTPDVSLAVRVPVTF